MTKHENYTPYRGSRQSSFKDDADKLSHQKLIVALTVTTGIASLACYALLKQSRVDARLVKSLYETVDIVVEESEILKDSYLLLLERFSREITPHIVDAAS